MKNINSHNALDSMDRAVCSIVSWRKIFASMPKKEQDALHDKWKQFIESDDAPESIVQHWLNSLLSIGQFNNAASSLTRDAIQNIMAELTYELHHTQRWH